jgi:hypothetical protein
MNSSFLGGQLFPLMLKVYKKVALTVNIMCNRCKMSRMHAGGVKSKTV